MNFNTYLEEIYAEEKVVINNDLQELQKNIDNYINNFSFHGQQIQNIVSRVMNNQLAMGETGLGKIMAMFDRLKTISFSTENSCSSRIFISDKCFAWNYKKI